MEQARDALLVFGRSDEVHRATRAGGKVLEVHTAADLDSLRAALRGPSRNRWRAVVYELNLRVPIREAVEIAELLSDVPCPVVVAPRFGRGFGRDIQRLALRRSDVVIALNCADDLERMIATTVGVSEVRSATGLILAGVGPVVPPIAVDCFAATSLLGETHCERERVAELVDRPLGTLQHHLRGAGAPTIRLQLRWRRSLGVVFRVCEMRETEEAAAAAGGWGSRSACSHAVMTCTGNSLADWRRGGGYRDAVDAYAGLWTSRSRA